MFIGIDLGTTNCKAAVFDEDMHMLSCVDMGYPLVVHSADEIEQDADVWWSCVLRVMHKVIDQADIDRKRIRAISVSAQGISIVPVARDGSALGMAISWMDTRADAQEKQLLDRFSAAEIFQRTGKRASRIYSLPKLMWLKEHRPDQYAAAYKILFPMDFIIMRLCGNFITDATIASGTMLCDVRRRCWDGELVGVFGLDVSKLPEIGCAGESAGYILPEVAAELGLSRDVCVAIGGQDQKCAALGAGIGDGIATVSLGTGSCISVIQDRPTLDEKQRIPCFSYLEEDKWVLEGVLSSGASCYDWFRRQFCSHLSYDELNALAAESPAPASERFYPSLSGASSPCWEHTSGALAGLTLDSDLGSMARSVLEGVAYGIRENLQVMLELGANVQRLRVFGGGSKSALWLQIIADVTGMRVEAFASGETALRGAAMLACQAVGKDANECLKPERYFTPEPEKVKAYNAAYKIYIHKRCE